MPRAVIRSNENFGMLDEHRKIIQSHHDQLVQMSDLHKLIPKFLEKKIFSQEMIDVYAEGTDIEAKHVIYSKIMKRGPHAFQNLIDSLKETNHDHLARLLSGDTNGNCTGISEHRGHAHPYRLPSYSEDHIRNIPHLNHAMFSINMNTQPLVVNVKKADKFYDLENPRDVYQTHSKHRGAVLIINNYKFINDIQPVRNGAQVDDKNLEELFRQMHFSVTKKINLTKVEFENEIMEFSKSSLLKDADMAFVFIMSHGEKNGMTSTVVCVDGRKVTTNWIEMQFNNNNCQLMHKRPKILVYQMCRGEIRDTGTRKIETDSSISMSIRTVSDMLVAHSTIEGFESHRDTMLGSWFIQLICEVFMDHAHTTDVVDLFRKVDQKLETLRSECMTMQTSDVNNKGFNKKCYLHPGIYYDDKLKYF